MAQDHHNSEIEREDDEHFPSSSQERTSIIMSPRVVALYKAAFKGDWAAEILQEDRSLITSAITDGGETALHIAALQGDENFVSKLLEVIEEQDMETPNLKGCTALCFAAAAGHTHIARLMVGNHSSLPAIKGVDGVRPLDMAALQGFHDMADFLYDSTDFKTWTAKEQIKLLTTAIDSQLYGLATKIVKDHPGLAIVEDCNHETPLLVLARNPLAFRHNTTQGRLWRRIITTVAPYMKNAAAETKSEGDAYTLLKCLWDAEQTQLVDIEAATRRVPAATRRVPAATRRVPTTTDLFFTAAESGNDDFLVELIRREPKLLHNVNESRHSIFHIAVERRYVKVFNLIYELGCFRDFIATHIDTYGNNILHLAAKLPPQHQLNTVSGAALQMQREVLWYKTVEKLVRPSYRNKKNNEGKTPHELFLSEHERLMEEGEKFMKQTAKSCMLVTVLIATVVFTTAFTVPGGNDNETGVPILQNNKFFIIFPVSEATATLSSLISMLMFLSILTSGYSDNDFLRALPFWLMVGLAMLFISIVAMMVAFCTCLLFFQHGRLAVILLLVFFGSVPTMFFILKFPLLVTVLHCTYSGTWLFRSYDRLHLN